MPSNTIPHSIGILNTCPLFDSKWYLSEYPDVAASGIDPAEHYLLFGGAEGRDPGPTFSSADYLRGNPDVQATGVNPLIHYIRCGQGEGRLMSSLHEQWIETNETLDKTDRAAIQEHIAALKRRPLISIVVPVYQPDPKHLRDMIASVKNQAYPHWELCIADDNSNDDHTAKLLRQAAAGEPRLRLVFRTENGHICAATNTGLDLATGEFVCFLDHDDLLHENALYEIAVTLNANPGADVVFSDSDCVDNNGRRSNPYFKTDWNYDLMLGHNMVSHMGAYRRSLVEAVGRMRMGYEGSQDYDLTLRICEVTQPARILHIPAILYHWRRSRVHQSFSSQSLERCVTAARRAVRDHLHRIGIRAAVECCPKLPDFNRVSYSIPEPAPLVTVGLVATSDPDDLIQTLSDVLFRTAIGPIEVLVVQPAEPTEALKRTLCRLESTGIARILRSEVQVNPVSIRNLVARQSRGEVVVLLDCGLRAVDPGWLNEMVSHALRPDVGFVGPLLANSDGFLTSSGIVLGAGSAAPLIKIDNPGYQGIFALTREVSALLSACVAFRRSAYVGVLEIPDEFASQVSQTESCVRARKAGLRNILTPYATLVWAKSRCDQPLEPCVSNGVAVPDDPFYNPNLSLDQLFSQTSKTSRRPKPWAEIRKGILVRANLARRADGRSTRSASTMASQCADGFQVIVGIAGTFDVENYGDLLFPLIASEALKRRNGNIRVQAFSMNAKSSATWPFQVERLDDLSASMSTLSAMLIGGGQIVRFDKFYPVPVAVSADLPLSYWLTPAVLAATAGLPVIWNAVGAWTGSRKSPRHDKLIRSVFEASYMIGIRDAASIDHLCELAPEAMLELLPDTAFALSRLWPLEEETTEFRRWRTSLNVPEDYVVIQASTAVEKDLATIATLMKGFGEVAGVVIPICWCHGDRAELFEGLDTKWRFNRDWLAPQLLSEIIGRSKFVFASSLHACITALSYGVPAARTSLTNDRKYEILNDFQGVVSLDHTEAIHELFRRGRTVESRVLEIVDRLERYWDQVADAALHPSDEHRKYSTNIMLRWVAEASAAGIA